MLRAPRCCAVLLLTVTLLPNSALGQSEQAGYRMPDPLLAALVDAPPTPELRISPRQDWLLLLDSPGLPSIEEVAAPELRLAGLRINPRSNGPSRQRTLSALRFQRLAPAGEAEERPVSGLPAEARLSFAQWSPDGERVACIVEGEDGLSLWCAELGDGRARRVGPRELALNAVYGQPYRWLPDGSGFVVTAVPTGRGAAPVPPATPTGPIVQENLGRKTPARTYQDLLQNRHDEALFAHYATAQLWRLDLKGKAKRLGEPAILRSAEPSPDGHYLLVEIVGRPFSYTLPEGDFPHRVEVWDLEGRRVTLLADLPLADAVPITFGSVPVGRRSFSWRDDAPATLCWVEALDGGDAGVEAAERDRVFTLAAPFTGEPQPLITLAYRYAGALWGNDSLAIVSEGWWKTRQLRNWHMAPGDPQTTPVLMMERSYQDRYADPGRPLLAPGPFGREVILTTGDGGSIFLVGEGASPEGNRPFLDRLTLASGETTRLFHSEAPYYERPVALLDVASPRLLTLRESQSEPPNYHLRDLAAGSLAAVTAFPDPTPQLAGIGKELIQYPRADGVPLTGKLCTPAGYRPGVDPPLPLIVWAYPQEFKRAADAGQVTDSPYRFSRVGWWSPLLFLTRGYAVLDDAAMPIVGEGDAEPNDSFIAQLVAGAQAAVDECARRGVADPGRVAVGGHSYGAFMVANLLAHSDLFRLGLARTGAYNRTLTPFGFQGEERSFWEAPETYFAMSPFMHADKVDEPILLVHGEADNNPGTFPMQSERFYEAIKGLGGTARLVLLPAESHSYRARESVMHLIWETDTWLERYVKNAPPREQAAR